MKTDDWRGNEKNINLVFLWQYNLTVVQCKGLSLKARERFQYQALPKSWNCQKGGVWSDPCQDFSGGFDKVYIGQSKVIREGVQKNVFFRTKSLTADPTHPPHAQYQIFSIMRLVLFRYQNFPRPIPIFRKNEKFPILVRQTLINMTLFLTKEFWARPSPTHSLGLFP